MENNRLNKSENLLERKSEEKTIKEPIFFNKQQTSQDLTNEQKLEYLSKIIQEVDTEVETKGFSKKLMK